MTHSFTRMHARDAHTLSRLSRLQRSPSTVRHAVPSITVRMVGRANVHARVMPRICTRYAAANSTPLRRRLALLLVHDLSNCNSYANLWRWYDEVVYGVAATTTTAGDHLVMPQLANSSGGGTGSGFSRSPSTDAMRVTRTTPPQTRRYAAGGGNATIGNALTTGFHRSVSATSESGGGLGGLGSTGFRSTSGSGGINSPEDITLRVIGNGTTTANTLTTSGTPALLPLLVVGTKRDRMTGMRASCEIAQEFGGQWADLVGRSIVCRSRTCVKCVLIHAR